VGGEEGNLNVNSAPFDVLTGKKMGTQENRKRNPRTLTREDATEGTGITGEKENQRA